MNNKKYLILIPIIIIFLFVISILLPSEIWSKFVDIFNIILAISATIIAIVEYRESEEENRKEKFSSIYSIFSQNQYQLRQYLNDIEFSINKNNENLLFYKNDWMCLDKNPIPISKISLIADTKQNNSDYSIIKKTFKKYNILPNNDLSLSDNLLIYQYSHIYYLPCNGLSNIYIDDYTIKITIKEGFYFDFINSCFPYGLELALSYKNKNKLIIRNNNSIYDFSNRFSTIGIVTLLVLKNVRKDDKISNYILIHQRGNGVAESQGLINAVPGSTFQQTSDFRYKDLNERLGKEGIAYNITREIYEEIFNVREFSYKTSLNKIQSEPLLHVVENNTYYIGSGINPINVYFEMLTITVLDFINPDIQTLFGSNNYYEIKNKIEPNYEGNIFIEELNTDILTYYRYNTQSAPTLQTICSIILNNDRCRALFN